MVRHRPGDAFVRVQFLSGRAATGRASAGELLITENPVVEPSLSKARRSGVRCHLHENKAAHDQHGGDETRRVQRFAKHDNSDDERANRADAGSDGVRRSER